MVGGVDEDLVLRVFLGELLHPGDRNVLVLVAEVAHQRHFRRHVRVVEDAAAVVGHGAGEARYLVRRHPGDKAAPAIADDADLAGFGRFFRRGLRVFHRHVGRDLAADLAPFRDVVGRVAEIDVLLHAVKHRRRDGDVAVAREAVGDALDVAVHAEDLLDHHDAAARLAGRIGAVRRERATIGCGEFDHLAHGTLLWGNSGTEPELA